MERSPLLIGGAVYLPNGYLVRTTVTLREALMLASGANRARGTQRLRIKGRRGGGGVRRLFFLRPFTRRFTVRRRA
ncbi:MAG: hypothetical protein WKF84_07375 [Pyrinomonadaceae bacterium]